jgi:hypothetical protein
MVRARGICALALFSEAGEPLGTDPIAVAMPEDEAADLGPGASGVVADKELLPAETSCGADVTEDAPKTPADESFTPVA